MGRHMAVKMSVLAKLMKCKAPQCLHDVSIATIWRNLKFLYLWKTQCDSSRVPMIADMLFPTCQNSHVEPGFKRYILLTTRVSFGFLEKTREITSIFEGNCCLTDMEIWLGHCRIPCYKRPTINLKIQIS